MTPRGVMVQALASGASLHTAYVAALDYLESVTSVEEWSAAIEAFHTDDLAMAGFNAPTEEN